MYKTFREKNMKSILETSITGKGGYRDYVNKAPHPTNMYFNFERIASKNHMYGWNTDVPAWDIQFTLDGSKYVRVGSITVFADGVNGSLDDTTNTLMDVSGTDPFELFVELVNKADFAKLENKFINRY